MSNAYDEQNAANVRLWRDMLQAEIAGALIHLPAAARAAQGDKLTFAIQNGMRVLAEQPAQQWFMDIVDAANLIGTAVGDWHTFQARQWLQREGALDAIERMTWTPVDVALHVR